MIPWTTGWSSVLKVSVLSLMFSLLSLSPLFAGDKWVDPVIVSRIDLPDGTPYGLALDGATYWYVDGATDQIVQIDSTGTVLSSFASPGDSPKGLTCDGTYLWLSESADDRIYKLDRQGNVLDFFSTPGTYPRGLAFEGAYLWHADSDKQTLYKFDTTGTLITSVPVPGISPHGVAFDGTHLWVADKDADTLYQISTTGTVLQSVHAPNESPYGLFASGSSLFCTTLYGDHLYYLKMTTIPASGDHLLSTRWNQRDEYARFTPDNYRAGCWSTALAQILYYFRLAPHGTVQYQTTTGYSLSEDLSAYTFDWTKFVDGFDTTPSESAIDEVARYVYYTALVIQKDFNTGTYVLSSTKQAEALETHYDCDTDLYALADLSRDTLKTTIRNELSQCRPVMLYLDNPVIGHAVVVDGVRVENGKFLVHVNMGSSGRENGWYDFDLPMLGIYEVNKIITVNPTLFDTTDPTFCTPCGTGFDCADPASSGEAYLTAYFHLHLPTVIFDTVTGSPSLFSADFDMIQSGQGFDFKLSGPPTPLTAGTTQPAFLSPDFRLTIPKLKFCGTQDGPPVDFRAELYLSPGVDPLTFRLDNFGPLY